MSVGNYRLTRAKRDSKAVDYLLLSEQGWKKVSHLFSTDGGGIENGITSNLNANKYKHSYVSWRLYMKPSHNPNYPYNIYGASGDSTFGMSPWFYYSQYAGNLKVSGELFENFIKRCL